MRHLPNTSRLLTAGALLLLAGGVNAQRVKTLSGTGQLHDDTNNRVIATEWLRNNGAVFSGTTTHTALGTNVAAAGDANGDGLADLLIAGFSSEPTGAAGTIYLTFGKSFGLAENLGLTNMTPGPGPLGNRANGATGTAIGKAGTDHVKFTATGAGSRTGAGLASAGDINGDGFDDLLIGAPRFTGTAGAESGVVYLVFGRADWPPTIDLGSLSGSDGMVIMGASSEDRLGGSVAGVGDVNGDGFDDMLLGAGWSSTFQPSSGTGMVGFGVTATPSHGGAAWLVYGTPSFSPNFGLDRFGAADGVILTGAQKGDRAGSAVAAAGDVNADGLADLIIGAPNADSNGQWKSGAAYVITGKTSLPAMIDLGNLGTLGLTLKGSQMDERLGTSVAGGSDLDDDGYDDVAVGAPGFDAGPTQANSDEGRVVLLFGQKMMTNSVSVDELNDSITAGGGSNFAGSGGSGRSAGGTIGYGKPKLPQAGILIGAAPGDGAGSKLAMGGNLNGDSFGDLLIGAEGSGSAFLLKGALGLDTSLSLSAMTHRGVEFSVGNPADTALAFVGDMDGDGFGDLVLGEPGSDPMGVKNAGQATVVKGCANFAVARGQLASDKTFDMLLHGTPQVPWLLLVSADVRPQPLTLWRGDLWLGDNYFEVLMGSYDEDGESVIPVHIPASGFAGVTVHWQAVTLAQGFGQDLTGLMTTSVEP